MVAYAKVLHNNLSSASNTEEDYPHIPQHRHSLRQVPYCVHNTYTMQQSNPIKALRLAVFFVAAGLASATVSKMILSEEKTDMSNNGTLIYGSLSFQEKMSLFKRYQTEADRKVIDLIVIICSRMTCELSSVISNA